MSVSIKQVFKSDTMKYAFALDVLGIIQINANELRAAIPPEYYGYFIIAVGIGIKFFRYITKEPLNAK